MEQNRKDSTFEMDMRRFDRQPDAREKGDLMLQGLIRATAFKKWIEKLQVLRQLRKRGIRNKTELVLKASEDSTSIHDQRRMAYQLAWVEEVRLARSELSGTVQTNKAIIDYGALQVIEDDFRRLEKSVAEFQEGENCRSVGNVKVVVDQLIREMMVRHVDTYGMSRLSEIYRDVESRYDHRWRFKETKGPTEGRITSQI